MTRIFLVLLLSLLAVGGLAIEPVCVRVTELEREIKLEPADLQTGRLAGVSASARLAPGRTRLFIRIRGLKEPAEACSNCVSRVIWAVPPSGNPRNLGSLPASGDFSGEFTTPLREFVVAVTDEPHFAVEAPCGRPFLVLQAKPGADSGARVALKPPNPALKGLCPGRLAAGSKDPWVPDMLLQARNAKLMAAAAGASGSDPGAFGWADRQLFEAERARVHGALERIETHAALAVQSFAAIPLQKLPPAGLLAALPDADLRDSPAPLRIGLLGRIVEHFEPGDTALSASAAARILDFTDAYAQDPRVIFRIRGHSDSMGAPQAIARAAAERAEAVARLLEGSGLPARRLRSAAFGDGVPEGSDDTEAGRQRNRRVEIEAVREP